MFVGWSLEAAEAVCPPLDPPTDVLRGLSLLVDHSLVLLTRGYSASPRYGMLDVIREYAAELLRDAEGEDDSWRRRHADYFLALAEHVEPRLRTADQNTWHRRLEADLANLRLAFKWSMQRGEARYALRLAGALWMFWRWHGSFAEGRRWLWEALRLEPDRHARERAKALWGAGWLAYDRGDYADTAALCGQLLDLAARTGDPVHQRNGLTLQGMTALADGRYAAAVTSFEHALTCARKTDSAWLVATSLLNRGVAAIHAGEPDHAEHLIEEAMHRYRDIGDELFQARATRYLAVCALLRGDQGRATDLFEHGLVWSYHLGESWGLAESLEGMSLICAATGRYERAAAFAGAAETLRETIGAKRHSFDEALAEPYLSKAQSDATAWRAGHDAGKAMPLAQIVQLVAGAA